MITFTCTWTGLAVSENDRLQPGRGRKKWRATAEYTAFKSSLAWTIRSRSLGVHLKGRVGVTLFIKLRNPDIDAQNVVKPCLDALETFGLIGNDNKVWRFLFEREEPTGYLDEIRFEVREMVDGNG